MIRIMEKTFIRVRSAKDLVISASIIISGIALMVLPVGMPVNITGFFMVVAGILLAFVLKSEYKDTDTGERFQKKEHYFQQTMNAPISSALVSKPESINLREADKGNAVKLDVYYSRKSGKTYLQLFEYVPYRYEPCTKVFEHPLTRVENLIK